MFRKRSNQCSVVMCILRTIYSNRFVNLCHELIILYYNIVLLRYYTPYTYSQYAQCSSQPFSQSTINCCCSEANQEEAVQLVLCRWKKGRKKSCEEKVFFRFLSQCQLQPMSPFSFRLVTYYYYYYYYYFHFFLPITAPAPRVYDWLEFFFLFSVTSHKNSSMRVYAYKGLEINDSKSHDFCMSM